MNKLDFSIKAGWPASAETWKYLQNMVLQAQNAGLLGGKNFIVSGCTVSGGNATDGLICINGEQLPFVGGPIQSKVIIVDTVSNREFFGGALNPYYHNRVATFGSGTGEVLWADFKRNNPDNGVLARLDKVEKMLKPLMGYTVGGSTVYGSWLFWGRAASEIPEGWEAVPDADWKGRVPVVLDAADPNFDTVGKLGGESTHTLTEAEFTHTVPIPRGDAYTGDAYESDMKVGGGQGANPQSVVPVKIGNSSGSVSPHNNLQPYRVVMFIRFIG